ncbi:MAG: inositol monophosphatase [Candidatus Paceibacterota bacterium]|jgi:myo-inositol-1(or 4)-monophosphatase
MKNKSKELKIAIKAAIKAGKILKKHFEKDVLKEFKEDETIVTIADRESEIIIKKIIGKAFPNHCLIGEESGSNKKVCEYVWHIDPLDGTRNFANGLPIFGVSIALVFNHEIMVGVVYNPVTKSLFYAEKNKGAYLNNKKIFVSEDDEEHAIIAVDPSKNEENTKLRKELLYSFPRTFVRSVRDLGSTAVELSYLARGSFEANIQLGLESYDFAAGALIVLEAGGKITKLDGSEWEFPENNFIASNGVFHDKLVEEIKKQKEKLKI